MIDTDTRRRWDDEDEVERFYSIRSAPDTRESIEKAVGKARYHFPDAEKIKVCRAYDGELIAEVFKNNEWKLYYTSVFLT